MPSAVWNVAFAMLRIPLYWSRRPVCGWAGVVAEMLLYAGILGNLIDRIVRGFVVDMFDFHWGIHHFPVFNVADSYITVAAALLVILGFFEKKASKHDGRA